MICVRLLGSFSTACTFHLYNWRYFLVETSRWGPVSQIFSHLGLMISCRKDDSRRPCLFPRQLAYNAVSESAVALQNMTWKVKAHSRLCSMIPEDMSSV